MIEDRLHNFAYKITLLSSLLLIVLLPSQSIGQFLDLTLEVESELTAATEQPLEFGTLTPNSGRIEIALGDYNMGIFSVRALENQNLLISLTKPGELVNDNPSVGQVIPLDLSSRFGYSLQNYENSFPLPDAASTIMVEPTPSPGPWTMLYIYMYGSIEIGDVPDGVYDNEILLSVEYL